MAQEVNAPNTEADLGQAMQQILETVEATWLHTEDKQPPEALCAAVRKGRAVLERSTSRSESLPPGQASQPTQDNVPQDTVGKLYTEMMTLQREGQASPERLMTAVQQICGKRADSSLDEPASKRSRAKPKTPPGDARYFKVNSASDAASVSSTDSSYMD